MSKYISLLYLDWCIEIKELHVWAVVGKAKCVLYIGMKKRLSTVTNRQRCGTTSQTARTSWINLKMCPSCCFFFTLDLSFLCCISLSRILLWHLFDIYLRQGLKSETSVCMPVFMRLSRSSLLHNGQRGRPTFRDRNNNGVQLFCQQLQRPMFSQGSFHPQNPHCFFPLVKTHPGTEEHFPSPWPC